MKARDLMSREVATVRRETPVWKIASVLLEKSVGAVPVVDKEGTPVGIVSDGDLIGRDEFARTARRDWWLALMAREKDIDVTKIERAACGLAGDVMSTPLVTIAEDAEAGAIARIMIVHKIKRAPVLKNGRLCGIVTRGDLQRALAYDFDASLGRAPPNGVLERWGAAIDEQFAAQSIAKNLPQTAIQSEKDSASTAFNFQNLVAGHEREEIQEREDAHRAALDLRRSRVGELMDRHVTDADWERLLRRAREVAESGEKEFMLLRFPSELCSDGSRAINVGEAGWPATLRGEAAEIYLKWLSELKPNGFHLSAHVIDFPDGRPGDVGLYLVWGEQRL